MLMSSGKKSRMLFGNLLRVLRRMLPFERLVPALGRAFPSGRCFQERRESVPGGSWRNIPVSQGLENTSRRGTLAGARLGSVGVLLSLVAFAASGVVFASEGEHPVEGKYVTAPASQSDEE